jgi:hypothetical protein
MQTSFVDIAASLNPSARAWLKTGGSGGFAMSRGVSFEGFTPPFSILVSTDQ